MPSAASSKNAYRAVAVTVCPAATLLAGEKLKVALPEGSVETSFWPKNFLPSFPLGLEENSTV